MVTTAHPLLLDETLAHILSYLDGRRLIQLRLVCSAWNIAALSVFKNKVKIRAEILKKVSSSSRIFSKKDLFTNLTFGKHKFLYDPNLSSDWTDLLCLLSEKDLCNAVTYIEVNCLEQEPKNVDSFLMALKLGYFPKLRALKIQDLDVSSVYNTVFESRSLASLRYLDLSVDGEKSKDLNFQNYCQKLVDAAPNLTKLNTEVPVNLTKHINIKHLGFKAGEFRFHRYSFSEGGLIDMLKSTEDRLDCLSLKNITLHYERLPEMNSMKTLTISDTSIETVGLKKVFPNLQTFKYHCTHFSWNANRALMSYLETGPQSLKTFETEFQDDWVENEHLQLVPLLPNLRRFVLNVKLTPDHNVKAKRRQLMSYLLNIDHGFVIVRIQDDCRVSSLIKTILTGVEEEGESRRGKTMCFEFPAPLAEKKGDHFYGTKEDDRMLKKFGRAMKTVAKSFDHIWLTGFKVSRRWIDKMHKDIRRSNLPVKMEFGIIPYENERFRVNLGCTMV